jgi:hypothetical protein
VGGVVRIHSKVGLRGLRYLPILDRSKLLLKVYTLYGLMDSVYLRNEKALDLLD